MADIERYYVRITVVPDRVIDWAGGQLSWLEKMAPGDVAIVADAKGALLQVELGDRVADDPV